MNLQELNGVVAATDYRAWKWHIEDNIGGGWFVFASFMPTPAIPGVTPMQYTRKWYIDFRCTKDEVVRTLFLCIMTAEEHEVREHFKYMGETIFGPHFSVDDSAYMLYSHRKGQGVAAIVPEEPS